MYLSTQGVSILLGIVFVVFHAHLETNVWDDLTQFRNFVDIIGKGQVGVVLVPEHRPDNITAFYLRYTSIAYI